MAESQVALRVRVQPGAGSDGIVGLRDSTLHIKVKAPPRKGQANRALVALLAEALGISKSDITITRGFTGRDKTLIVQGLTLQELKERLSRSLSSNKS